MTCPEDGFSLSGLIILVTVNSFCVFTESSEVLDIEAVNISATGMTLTWKINDDEPSSLYTFKIHVAGETDSLNLTVSETRAVITSLSPSTLYNITVRPFLNGSAEGIPGFLQVYTREFTCCSLTVLACVLCTGPRY